MDKAIKKLIYRHCLYIANYVHCMTVQWYIYRKLYDTGHGGTKSPVPPWPNVTLQSTLLSCPVVGSVKVKDICSL